MKTLVCLKWVHNPTCVLLLAVAFNVACGNVVWAEKVLLPVEHPSAKLDFDPRRGGLAFANDTVREYRLGADGRIVARDRSELEEPQAVKIKAGGGSRVDFKAGTSATGETAPRYEHSCFLVCRAVMQFHKFARFDPAAPRLSAEAYRPRLKHLFRIPVWFPDRAGKPNAIVIPGYKNLYEFSKARPRLIQETAGAWLPTYFRVGNWRMIGPFPRWGQRLASENLMEALDNGVIQAVYIARFPHLNHCLVVYDYTLERNGNVRFRVYDPNYPAESAWLRYHADTRSFELQKRFYFNAGLVNVMRVYISPLH